MKKINISIVLVFFVLFSANVLADIMISELMYNPSGTETKKEWIELYNSGPESVNITGWKIQDGTTIREMNIYRGEPRIETGSFAVIARSTENFSAQYPLYTGAIFMSTFSLANNGKELFLLDKNSQIVDFVNYTDIAEEDYTIELNGTGKDNSDMKNWILGISKGNPGKIILEDASPEIPQINETINETIPDVPPINETINVTIPEIPETNETINQTIPELPQVNETANNTIPDVPQINETSNETMPEIPDINETLPQEDNQTEPVNSTEDDDDGHNASVPEFSILGGIITVAFAGMWVALMRKN